MSAVLDGIKNKITPPPPVEEDVYEFNDTKQKFYIETLPSSLEKAFEEFEKSSLTKDTLGDYAFYRYLAAKKKCTSIELTYHSGS